MFTISATVFAGAHSSSVLPWAAGIAGLLLLAASLLCAWAAKPSDFYVSGYEPRRLITATSDIIWLERYTIEDIQFRIEANRVEINREAKFLKTDLVLAMAGIGMGLLIFLFGLFPNWLP